MTSFEPQYSGFEIEGLSKLPVPRPEQFTPSLFIPCPETCKNAYTNHTIQIVGYAAEGITGCFRSVRCSSAECDSPGCFEVS